MHRGFLRIVAALFFILTLMNTFNLTAHADARDIFCLDITASSISNAQTTTTVSPAPGEAVKHTIHFSVTNFCPSSSSLLPSVSNITIGGEDILTCGNGKTLHLTKQVMVPSPLAAGQAYGQDVSLIGGCLVTENDIPVASVLPQAIRMTISASGMYGSTAAIAPAVTYDIWPHTDGNNCPHSTMTSPDAAAPFALASVAQANPGCVVPISLNQTQYPLATQHILDAISLGLPTVLTLDRPGRAARGIAARAPYPSCGKDAFGKHQDRDEYPPAIALEGGPGADIRCILSSDNRGAGSAMGNALAPYSDGTQFRFVITP